jgi:hypothetical protein
MRNATVNVNTNDKIVNLIISQLAGSSSFEEAYMLLQNEPLLAKLAQRLDSRQLAMALESAVLASSFSLKDIE